MKLLDFLNGDNSTSLLNSLSSHELGRKTLMLQTLYLMQQAPDTSGAVPYSIGLVIVCLLLLILLWLPDILKQD
jgi:hypothetical protein